ncbi:hypothetical protein KJ359_007573 [Pestalotiopsis sp. 9143b]|nr:hypothetical protein KJ359_007573 [Pestalotiopsis sp. 9143b]
MTLIPGIASVSLRRSPAGHSLITKIEEAAKHGFRGIEIFYECLEFLARDLGGVDDEHLLLAATQARIACDKWAVDVVCLQPFAFYDGLVDEQAHQAALKRLRLWFRLAKILRTDLIQVPTNFQGHGTTGDVDTIVASMETLARLGRDETPTIRFAYEAVAWGTHIDKWEQSWDIVKRVNSPNLGLCLDTFHIAARVRGDPTCASGRTGNADANLDQSLMRMQQELDVNKVFYLQVGDAERLETPL